MAKIIVISGSPRAGSNSELIADRIAEGAKENGYEIVKYKINSLKNAKGCQSCMGCKKSGVCAVKDDIQTILEDVKASAGVIIATPVYFGQATAQLRLFQDRTFSFLDPTFAPFIEGGKKLAVAVTCGSGYDGAVALSKSIEGTMAGMFKFEPVGTIIAKDAMAPGCVAEDESIMDDAYAIGKKF